MALHFEDMVDPACVEEVSEKSHQCHNFDCKPEKLIIKYKSDNRGEQLSANFDIVNKTNTIQRVYIEGPKTKFFKCCLDDSFRRLFPGKSVQVVVSLDLSSGLTSPEYLTDELEVRCQQKCSSIVALRAQPVLTHLQDIPQVVELGLVPVGRTVTKKFVIKPIDKPMTFSIVCPIVNPDLKISPMKGEVDKKKVEVSVSYTPNSYITLTVPIHLYLPKIVCEPYLIKISAHTKPGALRDKVLKEAVKKLPPPGGQLKRPPLLSGSKLRGKEERGRSTSPGQLDRDAFACWSQHKTNKLLLRPYKEPGIEFQLIGPLNMTTAEEMEIKERLEKKIRREAGEMHKENICAMNSYKEKREEVAQPMDREALWSSYYDHFHNPPWDSIKEATFIRKRYVRPIMMAHSFCFTDSHPNMWFVRYLILSRFIEAGRKIIILNRLVKNLNALRILTPEDIKSLESLDSEHKEGILKDDQKSRSTQIYNY